MKGLNITGITAGLDMIKGIVDEANSIARDELVDADLIDFAAKNSYASEDTEESVKELADQIEAVGLLNPLGVIKEGGRYTLFSGERRYRAITQHLQWEKIPCRIFENVTPSRAQLMLHVANGAREYSPAKKLELYEEYSELLRQMKESGEFTGPLQNGIANLLNVSTRQVRTYRMMVEQLRPEEKKAVSDGEMSFGDAKAVAGARAEIEKNGTGSGFEKTRNPDYSNSAPKEEAMEAASLEGTDETEKPEIGTGSDFEMTSEIRMGLLEKAVREIWGWKKLYDTYVYKMPTTQEAIKEILRPAHGYRYGVLVSTTFDDVVACQYTCTSQLMELEIETRQEQSEQTKVTYKYAEIDALVRQLYREQVKKGVNL